MRRHLFIVLFVSSVASVCAPAPAAAADVVLRPPSDAAVLDPFRLPDGPYGAGNRGIEFDTRAGATIAAAGPGAVVFAGPVAGALHVTVDHGGGLRTSYSFVASIAVRAGDLVQAGQPVATAGGPFHFGARVDDSYVDPATLFGTRHVSVRLVAHDDPAMQQRWLDIVERSERLWLAQRFRGGGDGLWPSVGGVVDAVGSVVAALDALDVIDAGVLPALVDPRQAIADLVHLAELAASSVEAVASLNSLAIMVEVAFAVLSPPECTPAGTVAPPPARRRVAVVINGLNSSSGNREAMSQLDLGAHGYDAHDIHRFSYAGGLVDDGSTPAGVPTSAYGPEDTHRRLEGHIDRLGQVLLDIAAAEPGVVIDVYGHSLGGVVARHAVTRVGGVDGTVPVGTLVTLGSPHEGAPIAELVESAEASRAGRVVTKVGRVLADTPPDAPIMEGLSVSGFAGDNAHIPIPDGMHAVSIGDRGDLIVPASTTGVPGAHEVVVGGAPSFGAHGDLPGHPDVAREIDLALNGLPPACEGVWDRAMDQLQPRTIEQIERSGSAAALGVGLRVSGP